MNTENLVRWTFGDDLSDKQVDELVAKLHTAPRPKTDLDLALEHRGLELGQRLKILAALQRPDRAPVLGHFLLSLRAISFGVRDELIGFPGLPRSAVQQRVIRHGSVLLLRDSVFVRAVFAHIRQYRTRHRQTLLVRAETCTLQYMSGVSGRTDTSGRTQEPEMIHPPTYLVTQLPATPIWQTPSRGYIEASAATSAANYELPEQENAAIQLFPDSTEPARTWWDRWAGWILLAAIATITTITFIAAVILGNTTIGQYIGNWLLTAFVLSLLTGLSQAF